MGNDGGIVQTLMRLPWARDRNDCRLCIQEKRIATKDNTVSYKNKVLQIPTPDVPCRFAKKSITVHEYSNGEISFFFGPRHLGRYDVSGQLVTNAEQKEGWFLYF